MNGWGNNPSTYEAIATVIAAVGVIAVFVSTQLSWQTLREMRSQRTLVEGEIAARLRPWIGLFGFAFEPGSPEAEPTVDKLRLLLKNFGELPAQAAKLSFIGYPLKRGDGEPDNTIRWEETGEKALVPGEEGNYSIEISKFPQFKVWRDERRDIRIEGRYSYKLDKTVFISEFEINMMFSQGKRADDSNVKSKWRNTRVS